MNRLNRSLHTPTLNGAPLNNQDSFDFDTFQALADQEVASITQGLVETIHRVNYAYVGSRPPSPYAEPLLLQIPVIRAETPNDHDRERPSLVLVAPPPPQPPRPVEPTQESRVAETQESTYSTQNTQLSKQDQGRRLAEINRQRKSMGLKNRSQSSRAGCFFPVSRIYKHLKSAHPGMRITKDSGVYLTAVLEYLTAEVLEVAGEKCMEMKRKSIKPSHIKQSVDADAELKQLFGSVTIKGGGGIPHIEPSLMMKPRAKTKAPAKAKPKAEANGKQERKGVAKTKGQTQKAEEQKAEETPARPYTPAIYVKPPKEILDADQEPEILPLVLARQQTTEPTEIPVEKSSEISTENQPVADQAEPARQSTPTETTTTDEPPAQDTAADNQQQKSGQKESTGGNDASNKDTEDQDYEPSDTSFNEYSDESDENDDRDDGRRRRAVKRSHDETPSESPSSDSTETESEPGDKDRRRHRRTKRRSQTNKSDETTSESEERHRKKRQPRRAATPRRQDVKRRRAEEDEESDGGESDESVYMRKRSKHDRDIMRKYYHNISSGEHRDADYSKHEQKVIHGFLSEIGRRGGSRSRTRANDDEQGGSSSRSGGGPLRQESQTALKEEFSPREREIIHKYYTEIGHKGGKHRGGQTSDEDEDRDRKVHSGYVREDKSKMEQDVIHRWLSRVGQMRSGKSSPQPRSSRRDEEEEEEEERGKPRRRDEQESKVRRAKEPEPEPEQRGKETMRKEKSSRREERSPKPKRSSGKRDEYEFRAEGESKGKKSKKQQQPARKKEGSKEEMTSRYRESLEADKENVEPPTKSKRGRPPTKRREEQEFELPEGSKPEHIVFGKSSKSKANPKKYKPRVER